MRGQVRVVSVGEEEVLELEKIKQKKSRVQGLEAALGSRSAFRRRRSLCVLVWSASWESISPSCREVIGSGIAGSTRHLIRAEYNGVCGKAMLRIDR